jgi:hypothetical protein
MNEVKSVSLTSVKWTFLGMVLPKLLVPIYTIVLARLISPNDMGSMGICVFIIGLITLIQGLGISEYIIKDNSPNNNRINTAFWIGLVLSIFLVLIVFFTSPFLSIFYKNPHLEGGIKLLSITIILNGLGTVHNALLLKDLRFKSLFIIQMIPILISFTVTIPLAINGYGYWSMIWGEITRVLVTIISYWIFCKWRPEFYFTRKSFLLIFKFGKWITLEKIIEFVYSNLDKVLLGFFLSIKDLGVYVLARSIILMIFNIVNGPIGAIIYPLLNKVGSSRRELIPLFFKLSSRLLFLNIPVVFLAIIAAQIFFPFFFESKWENLVVIFSIATVSEGISRLLWVQRDIFKLLGLTDIYPKSLFFVLLFSCICNYFGVQFGIMGFVISKLVVDVGYTLIQLYITSLVLKFKFKQFFELMIAPFISSVTSFIISYGCFALLENHEYLRIFSIIIFLPIFLAVFRLLDFRNFYLYLNDLKLVFYKT